MNNYRLITLLEVTVFLAAMVLYASDNEDSGNAVPQDSQKVLVMEAGKNTTVIVLAEKPTTSAQYAALELQYHLEKITGEKPPIVREPEVPEVPVKLAVGNTLLAQSLGFNTAGLRDWEFLVAHKNGVIVLAGEDAPGAGEADWNTFPSPWRYEPVGTCNAVYEFLEECCDVQWPLPVEAAVACPRTSRLVARMAGAIRRRTDFRSTSLYPKRIPKKLYWRPGTSISMEDMIPSVEVYRWLMRNKVGGEAWGPNHSFGKWLNMYGREHPEWFSFKNKEKIEAILEKYKNRVPSDNEDAGQPCLTEPGVFNQVLADARDYFDHGPQNGRYSGSVGRFFSITMEDHRAFCHCPNCQPMYNQPVYEFGARSSGEHSMYYWTFVNNVAREIQKTHSNAWIAGNAYMGYRAPPKNFVLEPNVAVQICAGGINWSQTNRECLYQELNVWRNICKAQWIGVWEYDCAQFLGKIFPRVFPRFMAEDTPRLHELGVVATFSENEENYWETSEIRRKLGDVCWANPIRSYLNIWTRWKMCDNTRRSPDEFLARHYHLFYGPAAYPIQSFFELLEQRITDPSVRYLDKDENASRNLARIEWEILCPPEVLSELRGYVDEAVRLATEEPFATRVGWVREGIVETMEPVAREAYATKYLRQPRQMVCYRLAKEPVIDGTDNDPAWAALPFQSLGEAKTGSDPKVKTRFRLGFDDRNLYLFCRCEEPEVKDLRATHTQSDVWRDDCVELMVCFDPERKKQAHIVVNSAGTVEKWDCGNIKAKAKVDDTGFSIELKTALNGIGCSRGRRGVVFHGNVGRERYAGMKDGTPECFSWSASSDFQDIDSFGAILFCDRDAWSAYFGEDSPLPEAELRKITPAGEAAVIKDAVVVTRERDCLRIDMKFPACREETNGIVGEVSFPLSQPVEIDVYPFGEIRFHVLNPDMTLTALCTFVAKDGREYTESFPCLVEKNQMALIQTFVWDLGKTRPGQPVPKWLKSFKLQTALKDNAAPAKHSLWLHSIRFCRETITSGAGETNKRKSQPLNR